MEVSNARLKHIVKESFEDFISEIRKARNPQYQIISFATQPIYAVDYKERKHVYAYTNLSGITLSSNDGYTISLIQNGWTNLAVPPTTRFTSSNNTAIVVVKCTDEIELSIFGSGGSSSSGIPTSSTATLTSVASSASSVTLLAANASRKGMTVFNDSTAILYLAFAATASTSAYTVQIPANGFYEMPPAIYLGTISGIWSVANGNARITELS